MKRHDKLAVINTKTRTANLHFGCPRGFGIMGKQCRPPFKPLGAIVR